MNTQEMNRYFKQGFSDGYFVDSLPGIDFKIGDIVTYTNDDGIEYKYHRIVAFGTKHYLAKYGHCVFLDKDSFWYPVKPGNITKQ